MPLVGSTLQLDGGQQASQLTELLPLQALQFASSSCKWRIHACPVASFGCTWTCHDNDNDNDNYQFQASQSAKLIRRLNPTWAQQTVWPPNSTSKDLP